MKKIYFVLMLVSVLFVSCNTGTPVSLSEGTTYIQEYYPYNKIVVGSGGKTLSRYSGTDLCMTYQIKNGNELWTKYGKVAKVHTLWSGRSIYFDDFSTEDVAFWLNGGTGGTGRWNSRRDKQ